MMHRQKNIKLNFEVPLHGNLNLDWRGV